MIHNHTLFPDLLPSEKKGFHCPPKPTFTVQEEFIETTRRVNETLDRVLRMEDCIRKTLDDLSSTLTADNVAFKNLCTTTYNQFSQTVTNEVNAFEAEILNSYKLFEETVKNDNANFNINYDNFKNEINTKINDFQSTINETYNNFRQSIENRIEDFNINNEETFNSFVTTFNKRLADAEANLTNMYNEFVKTVNNTVDAYKADVTNRLYNQDAKIEDTEHYFKTNFTATVTSVLDTMRVTGELADIINEQVLSMKVDESTFNDTLKTLATKAELNTEKNRINNLASLSEGSTTGDAELIDGRVGVDGTVYSSIGESIREQLLKERSRTTHAIIATSYTPKVEFIAQQYISVEFTGNIAVFADNKRYDVPACKADYTFTEYYSLFVVLFNKNLNKIEVQPSSLTIGEEKLIIGIIYEDRLYINGFKNHKSCTDADSLRPLYATVYCDYQPYVISVKNEDNTTTHTLYYGSFNLYTSGKQFSIHNDNKNPKTVTLTVGSSLSLFYILVDVATKEVKMLPHGNIIADNYLMIGFYHVNNGVALNNMNFMHCSDKKPLAILPSISEKYVKIDTINKIIDFNDDTLLLVEGAYPNTWNRFYHLTNEKGNTSLNYAHMTTSAISIYYNHLTDKMECQPYGNKAQPYQHYVCSLRTTTGMSDLSIPYTVDGKLFNLVSMSADLNKEVAYSTTTSAHRGGLALAPENTLTAFKNAKKMGFDLVECDVSFTKDGIAVLLHDETIDRTSDGTGNISDIPYEELLNYDFGGWFDAQYIGEKIPTFEEFIHLCKNINLKVNIELKTAQSPSQEQINNLVNVVKKYSMMNNVSWISFSSVLLSYVRNAEPTATLALICGINETSVQSVLDLRNDVNIVKIIGYGDTFADEKVQLCINNNIPLESGVQTNNLESALAMHPYVSGFTSDGFNCSKEIYLYNIQ